MGPPAAVAALPRVGFARLAGVGAVVFLANAGLLVLQLVAGRLLAPFVGSSLETWTSVIGGFLAGIALGNAVGGRLADRGLSGRRLAAVLALGAGTALWMVGLPAGLDATGVHRGLPLGVRIPVLAVVMCFPPGFVLSLLTPMAIRLGLPDVRHAGRVAGLIFALSTLGCLAGNYVTGFVLIPHLTINTITFATAGLLLVTAAGAFGFAPVTVGAEEGEPVAAVSPLPVAPARVVLPLRKAFAIVFLASFAGMALELAAARLMAQILGVSLFTWTGVIGVMLAGTACGNWLGGILADRSARSADPERGADRLSLCLVLAAAAMILVLAVFHTVTAVAPRPDASDRAWWVTDVLYHTRPFLRVVVWSFPLFFLPMAFLGTVSPQAIRLAVPDVGHAGRVAGRVYAWSTAGAIAGTFATGYLAVSAVGVDRTVLLAAVLPGAAAVLAARVWERSHLLYTLSVALGAVIGGFILLRAENTKITKETNYYAIKVVEYPDAPQFKTLVLDLLIHSAVDVTDPTFIHYQHEQIQIELLRAAAAAHPAGQEVLVIGGGGYTFPRAARVLVPTAHVDVVEIDPGVTAVAYSHLGLDPALGVRTFNMDGRQFVAETAARGHYNLISLDAVNDLSVPYHLLTREFNEAVKAALTPDGVYLLTVIDMLEEGPLWRAGYHTLRQTFPHVEVLRAATYDPYGRQVYVIYASNAPLDLDRVHAVAAPPRPPAFLAVVGGPAVEPPFYTRLLPPGETDRLLAEEPTIVLTDQFAPVDNLMAVVYRRRE